jgi:uncharacterized membrane protein (DUF2068 family)
VNQSANTKVSAVASTEAEGERQPIHHAPVGLCTVALFEAGKGLIVLVAGLGLLSLVHRDAQSIAEEIVRLLHLNPAHRSPQIFMEMAAHLNDTRLWFLSLGALVYSTVRFVEAYGLWHEKSWAEWFAVISASLYLPIETYKFIEKRDWLTFSIPVINLGIVIYLAWLLFVSAKKSCATDG